MVGFNDNDTLVLGGYRFSKMHNRKKGILVTSVDPDDTSQCVVVSSNEGPALDVSNYKAPMRNSQQRKETELAQNALVFCRLVNKLLRSQNSSVFVGYEVIYTMVSSGLAKNRAEALNLGKDLSKRLRLFYRVESKRNTFSDDGKLYKFRPDVLLSVIIKSPMIIENLTPLDDDIKTERLKYKPMLTSDVLYSHMKIKKFAPKKDFDEPKAEEPSVEMNMYGKPKKKGRRPKAKQMKDMKPQDQCSRSEEDWRNPKHGHLAMMDSIRERSCEDDDDSIFTEVTVSESDHTETVPQHDIDEDSYMELTVSTGAEDSRRGSTHSYFDEYTLEDEDEYDIMSITTTPVVKEKMKGSARSNLIPINDFFSPNGVTGFEHTRRSVKVNQDSSLRSRMRRGDLDIEIPNLDMPDEDLLVD